MIEISKLTEKDKGRWVVYTCFPHDIQVGRIKGWTKEIIWVVYKCNKDWDNYMNYAGIATAPDDLTDGDEYKLLS